MVHTFYYTIFNLCWRLGAVDWKNEACGFYLGAAEEDLIEIAHYGMKISEINGSGFRRMRQFQGITAFTHDRSYSRRKAKPIALVLPVQFLMPMFT